MQEDASPMFFQATKHNKLSLTLVCARKASIKLQNTFCLQKPLHTTFSWGFVFSVKNQLHSKYFFLFDGKLWSPSSG